MDFDNPLFDPALAAFALTAYYQYPYGWRLRVTTRQEGAADWRLEGVYENLSTAEALDVATASLAGLAERRGLN